MSKPFIFSIALVALYAASLPAADVSTRVKALNDLLAEQHEASLQNSPEWMTIIGDYRNNDRWIDVSPAYVKRYTDAMQSFVQRFKAIDTTGFSEQDRLNRDLIVQELEDNIRSNHLKLNEMLLDPNNGLHSLLEGFVSSIPFDNTKHYEDYIARLNRFPAVWDQLIDLLKQGEKDHMMPPRYLLERVVAQCRSTAELAGETNPFGRPAARIPDTIPEADRKRLHDDIVTAVDTKVRPAYRKLADFVANDYAPKGRSEPGLWALPNGAAIYQYLIEHTTSSHMSADEIHSLGLSEVRRIEGEQLKLAQRLGYSDLKTFRTALMNDPKTHATSREQMVDLYRKYISQMQAKLPQLFSLVPPPLAVLQLPENREDPGYPTQYDVGTLDGTRPCRLNIDTGNFKSKSLLLIEATAYASGVPGRHLQTSTAMTLANLPAFRQQAYYPAYIRGWSSYARRLGQEVGFYQDQLSLYGYLSAQLVDATRLVLDTGVHQKRWSLQQMTDFLREHSISDQAAIQSDVDRYTADPAQGLSYTLGEIKILELRERTKKELGGKFDIRAFNDEILNGGPMPLGVLDARINSWIAEQKSKLSAKSTP